jgi:LuxR family transcriptional regulator, maltose regulon positive regulatory protein
MLLAVSSATALQPRPMAPQARRAAQRRAPGDSRAGAKPPVARSGAGRAHGRGLPPPRAAGLVPRARLIRRLGEASDVPLALLVAPAGYGKTTVLSEWAEHDPRPFRWMSLAAGQDDPATALAGLAEEVAAARQPSVLVLDDAHTLRGADAFRVLEAIVEAIPRGSQLALATRGEPALAVGRLRAHRKVVELRTADLAMGRSEAAALLDRAGLRLGGEDLDTLVRRTEGWPAGLYLAALSLRAQPDRRAAVEQFAGDDRLVADYVRDELLAPLSRGRVAFLTRTSVLDTLSASACDAVLDSAGSGARLADLARSNVLLVSLDRNGESYRHHGLFADALRAELRRAEPDLEPELHRRASAWYAARGEAQSAIRHAVAAGDVRAAADLLWSHAASRIAHGGNDTVRRWLEEFTGEQIAACAPLALVAAASWLATGDRGQVERWTMQACRSLVTGAGQASGPQRAAATILRACVARDGLSRMGADAARASRAEPDHSTWRSTGRWLEGVAHHLTGRREDARAPLEEGGRGGAAAAPNIQALCLAQLALLVIEDEDWDQAAVLIGRARSQVKACGLERYPTVSLVFAVSGLVRAHRGMIEDAREDVLWSAGLLRQLADFAPWYEAETRIALARTTLRLGDVTAARTLMAEGAHSLRDIPDSTTLRAWLEEMRTGLDAATRAAGETCALTTAELRVLRLLPTHLSFPAIASRLYVSPNTVKTHARAVYRKLDASSRGEAVAHAFAAGLLDDVQAA